MLLVTRYGVNFFSFFQCKKVDGKFLSSEQEWMVEGLKVNTQRETQHYPVAPVTGTQVTHGVKTRATYHVLYHNFVLKMQFQGSSNKCLATAVWSRRGACGWQVPKCHRFPWLPQDPGHPTGSHIR